MAKRPKRAPTLDRLERGRIDWYPLDAVFLANRGQHPPEFSGPGVYALRWAGGPDFGRLSGRSTILYIGKTESLSGVRVRLNHYVSHFGTPRNDARNRPGITNQRIHRLLCKFNLDQTDLEFAVFPCGTGSPANRGAANLESTLLREVLTRHGELPPFNSSLPHDPAYVRGCGGVTQRSQGHRTRRA
jgi:hypothetical protein